MTAKTLDICEDLRVFILIFLVVDDDEEEEEGRNE